MLGSPAGPGGPSQRGLWPLAPAPAPATSFTADGFSKCGVYSLFPGGPSFGSALYSHSSTIGRFASGHIPSGNPFNTAHKVSDSLFSSAGYTFGAPTPPPGSPYSPVPVTQLELLTKGFNSNIIIQQPDYPISPKKLQIQEKQRCDEKCCNLKPQKTCNCQLGSPVKKFTTTNENNNNNNNSNNNNNNNNNSTGCSRTNPIEWSGVNVKKEPGSTPCQVAEITTSVSPVVKLEVTSPKNSNDCLNGGGGSNSIGNSNNGNNIPVGIAVARQRFHQQEIVGSPSLPPAGLLTTINAAAQIKDVARISEIGESTTAGMAASTTGGGAGGGALLQSCDERGAALAGWPMGGTHNSTLTTPTLWQYPAPIPMEPMVPLPVPMPPVGFQLVRDPTTGGLLLLPTAGIESLQQAVVWPSYHQPPSVLLPPLPPPPLQLLSSASSDYLSSSTTLHQHTQTHSTRLLLTTDNKRTKIPLPIPTTTLIKIETDATLDQTKTLQAVSTIASNRGTVFTEQSVTPLVTTHVIYQHPTNLILSQPPPTTNSETICRSQATSPVTCLTPPPEQLPLIDDEPPQTAAVQDASNQTDTPIFSEDDNTTHTISDVLVTSSETKKHYEDTLTKQEEIFVDATKDNSSASMITQVPEDVAKQFEPEEPCEEAKIPNTIDDNDNDDDTEKPDLSGLELLSNSIVEFENCRNHVKIEQRDDVLTGIAHMTLKDCDKNPSTTINQHQQQQQQQQQPQQCDDSLGGLDLLCALAEQRIMEECEEKTKLEKEQRSKEHKREKRKSKKHSDEPKRKKHKSDNKYNNSSDKNDKVQRANNENIDLSGRNSCCCRREDNYRSYKTAESEEEVKKFIASKTQSNCCKGDWPCMNAMELDMRMKLADLQRQYREKQKELSKLKPKKQHVQDCTKKRSRKKSTHSDKSLTPPPLLDKIDMSLKPSKNHQELLKPPTLCAFENLKVPRLEAIKQSDRIINDYKNDMLRQQQQQQQRQQQRQQQQQQQHQVLDEIESSPEKNTSSKKRKVGRPKKLMSPSGFHVQTETIVAKKPKNNFVGYLLAAKEKLQMQNKLYSNSPPRYVEEPINTTTTTTTINTNVHRTKKYKNNNHIIVDEMKTSKIRPKLKAEPMIKSYNDYEEEQPDWESTNEDDHDEDIELTIDDDDDEEEIRPIDDEKEEIKEENPEIDDSKPVDCRCTLTAEHLEIDKLRVLTAMGGLFYAGHLNAVEPPDVYSITLDGERGNRPHIMSREEILRDAIVEVAPKNTEELVVGTRLCAYWSQQYRCLYPGSVAEPGTPDPALDSKFVAVEFDDGDSGRIAIEDIRLLPPDYPIIEYDPNPLLSLSKRRRRTSTSISTEERRPQPLAPPAPIPSTPSQPQLQPPQPITITELSKPDLDLEKENKDTNKPDSTESHKERKRLKKKKREKLKQKLLHEDKKKKKKHRCTDEFCKHKKHHKKHRKHKKHHHYVAEKIEQPPPLQVIEEVEETEPVEDVNNVTNPEDEVTMDDIIEATKSNKKSKKIRDRQESCESRSKMSAFLPARQLWGWSGKGYKRPRAKGRSRKQFYKAIQRGKETIIVGDSAVFLSTGRPDRPYIGRIEAMWEFCGTMVVKVKWFYHPEETVGCPLNLQYPGALFESPHVDENDVQTISHKCEVLPLKEYTERLGDDPQRYATIYDNNDIYYLAGYYDPTSTTLKMEPEIPFTKSE